MLIKKANKWHLDFQHPKTKFSALHIAVSDAALCKNMDNLKLLLSHGANPHLEDSQDRHPLNFLKELRTGCDTDFYISIESLLRENMKFSSTLSKVIK